MSSQEEQMGPTTRYDGHHIFDGCENVGATLPILRPLKNTLDWLQNQYGYYGFRREGIMGVYREASKLLKIFVSTGGNEQEPLSRYTEPNTFDIHAPHIGVGSIIRFRILLETFYANERKVGDLPYEEWRALAASDPINAHRRTYTDEPKRLGVVLLDPRDGRKVLIYTGQPDREIMTEGLNQGYTRLANTPIQLGEWAHRAARYNNSPLNGLTLGDYFFKATAAEIMIMGTRVTERESVKQKPRAFVLTSQPR